MLKVCLRALYHLLKEGLLSVGCGMFILHVAFQGLYTAFCCVYSETQECFIPAWGILHIPELKLEVEWAHPLPNRDSKTFSYQTKIVYAHQRIHNHAGSFWLSEIHCSLYCLMAVQSLYQYNKRLIWLVDVSHSLFALLNHFCIILYMNS